jgi:transcriptional regulator with XRE-family HTH domain
LAVSWRDVSESKHSDLGEFIRQQRERANLSLRRLAEKAGISNPYLSQIERGIRRPSAEILKSLSRALEISANSLYTKAGLIDEDLPPATVFESIEADARLTADQKKVLLDMYRALVRSNGSTEETKE